MSILVEVSRVNASGVDVGTFVAKLLSLWFALLTILHFYCILSLWKMKVDFLLKYVYFTKKHVAAELWAKLCIFVCIRHSSFQYKFKKPLVDCCFKRRLSFATRVIYITIYLRVLNSIRHYPIKINENGIGLRQHFIDRCLFVCFLKRFN